MPLSKDFKIRRAMVEDAKEIARVHIDSWRITYRGIVSDDYLNALSYEDRAARWAEEGKGHLTLPDPTAVFIAEADGKISGFADIGPAHKSEAELYAIYVAPDSMGQGVGRALFNTCIEYAKKFDFQRVTLSVMSENNTARRFYERMNGQVVPNSEILEKIAGGKERKIIRYQWPVL